MSAFTNSAKFSASAQEFVPSFQYGSYEMNNTNSFGMNNTYQYTNYMMQDQANPYAQYNATQTTWTQTQHVQNVLISLDDYSDYSSDDEPQQTVAKPSPVPSLEPITPEKTVPVEESDEPCEESAKSIAESVASDEESDEPAEESAKLIEQSLASDEEGSDPATPKSSTCEPESDSELATPKSSTWEPESDSCSLELEASDNDQDGSMADEGSFSVLALLKLRHSVPWEEGLEEGLTAEEVELPTIPEDEKSQQKEKRQQAPGQSRPAATRNRGRKSSAKKDEQQKSSDKKSSDKKSSEKRKESADDDFFARRMQKEEIQVSESSWLAQQKAHREAAKAVEGEVEISTEEVVRKMKSILNKLTIEKFDPLYEKLVSCGIRTTVHLQALIHEVFEKATMQHHFVNMYADLCARLHGHFSQNPITDDPTVTFKKILLDGCQSFFEKHLKPPSNLEDLDEEERLVLNMKYKTQMLGNIKFVGALLVRQMLATKVLFAICQELLGDPTPESLESVACLLTVVGPKFDVPSWAQHAMFDSIFKRVKVLAQTTEIKSRVRCLLKDVLELRAAKWQDKKPKKMEGPSTLKAVADTQASDLKASGTSNATRKSSGKAPAPSAPSRESWGKSPGQGAPKPEKAGDRKASDLFTRNPGSPKTSPKSAAPKESYERIHSLAALKAGARAPASAGSKEAGVERPRKQTGDERPRKQPIQEPFDQEACRKEVSGALAEMRYTHEVQEALSRISALSVPSSKQSDELCDMLAHMAEEGSAAVRKASFELVASLFAQGHWKPHALGRGLQEFVGEVCPDLKCDIPMLPTILRDELGPALSPLVDSGALQRSQHDALIAAC